MLNDNLDNFIIKKENFPILNKDSSLYDAIFLMNKHQLGTVCIVNDSYELLGIFTDGDLRRIFLTVQKPLSAILIQDIFEYMNDNPIYISNSTSQTKIKVLGLMKKNKIWDIPILDGKRLYGIIHLHDILDD